MSNQPHLPECPRGFPHVPPLGVGMPQGGGARLDIIQPSPFAQSEQTVCPAGIFLLHTQHALVPLMV